MGARHACLRSQQSFRGTTVKVISAYSIKGGVGKTSAAVNLAYLSALEGARTLIWDLDPNATATPLFGLQLGSKTSIRKLVFGDSKLAGVVSRTHYANLDIVPGDLRHRILDTYLDRGISKAHRRLDALLAPLAADYDCVVLDCPPGINVLAESIFYASDLLLVPIVPTTQSVRAFDLLAKYVNEEQRKDRLRDISIMAFFSMVDRRKQLQNSFVEVLPEERPGVLGTVIPETREIEQMRANHAPVHAFAPASRTAAAYEELWHEVEQRMGNNWTGMAIAGVR
jgi:chromosome partitioning protein